ncbi:hypothetical protein TELCIR_13912, partial [Teladorsagia circumcincta]
YWPDIDDALRSAAFRGVAVKLLVSHWNHSRPAELAFLRSLVAINDGLPTKTGSISVKLFTVPSSEEQQKIPFARVNHNKYMVTDRAAYVDGAARALCAEEFPKNALALLVRVLFGSMSSGNFKALDHGFPGASKKEEQSVPVRERTIRRVRSLHMKDKG